MMRKEGKCQGETIVWRPCLYWQCKNNEEHFCKLKKPRRCARSEFAGCEDYKRRESEI